VRQASIVKTSKTHYSNKTHPYFGCQGGKIAMKRTLVSSNSQQNYLQLRKHILNFSKKDLSLFSGSE
jgi:hypothetical protein